VSYTPLKIPTSGAKSDTATKDPEKIAQMMRLNYYSMTHLGIGSTKITNGFFEAEPYTVSVGLPNWAERVGVLFLVLLGCVWVCFMVLPTLYYFGYADFLVAT